MKKILIIEDDPSIREILTDLLEIEGYSVLSGANGLEGLHSLQRSIPDLILMDILMPVMDGYAFRRELLKDDNLKAIPVIAMSAQSQALEKLMTHQLSNFINKPIKLNHLLQSIKTVIR